MKRQYWNTWKRRRHWGPLLHTRVRARDQYGHFKHTRWWETQSRSKFATSHYAWGTNWVLCEHKMDGMSTWIPSYMASNGSCFVVTWTIFKNHFLEVGLAQKRETMALWMFAAIGLSYFIMCEDLHEWKFIVIAFGWGSGHVWLHTTLEGPWPHYMSLEVCWGCPLDTFFGLLARVWSGPEFHKPIIHV